jgi:hypothetical protein
MRFLIDERPMRVARNLSVGEFFSQEGVGGGQGGKVLLSTCWRPLVPTSSWRQPSLD